MNPALNEEIRMVATRIGGAAGARDTIKRLTGLHEKIVADVPALRRGQVWCRSCGATMKVDSAECLRHGWPKCCGYTMTIDPPEDWRTHSEETK